ncbi:MAG: Gfo/Idh/MocA family oxidoreductase, partial [Verrucomicrobia bacterium]|nr:Gfo/Idh/MocA family oxidoreductase [Verrucomicrobiota bacterium]
KAAGMTPTAVAEIDASRRAEAEKEFPGIQTYASVTTMLRKADLDLVAIITPHNTHAKLALQCLRANCHVVCEKPFAITTAECDAMIREAKKRKLVVSTYHNRHWDGCILEALKHIRKKREIGEIVRVSAFMGGVNPPREWWRCSKSISGGVLYDWGVHMLEYALQLIDSEIVEVSGFAHEGYWTKQSPWKKDTIEDEATAVVRFKNGVLLTLTISTIDHNGSKRNWLEVTGTKGSYAMRHGDYDMVRTVNGERVEVTAENTPTKWQAYYQNISNHLVKGTALVIPGEWARRPIHILDLARRSARLGRTLKATHR